MSESKELLDFRYYDMPQKDPVIVFSGEKWKRVYGESAPGLHFHNILEIGICREGKGRMLYEHEERMYQQGAISLIPDNCPHNTLNEPGEISWWEYIFVDVHAYLQRAFGTDEVFVRNCEERIRSRACLLRAEEHPDMAHLINAIIEVTNAGGAYAGEIRTSYILAVLLLIARENRTYVTNQTEEFRTRSRQVLQALHFISLHYMDDILTADIAKAVHII